MSEELLRTYIYEYKDGPLLVKRLYHIFLNHQDDAAILIPIIQKLINLTAPFDSPYHHFSNLSVIRDFIRSNSISNKFKYPKSYYNGGETDRIIVHDISSKQIENNFNTTLQTILNTKPPSDSVYHEINKLIDSKSIDTLLISNGGSISESLLDHSSVYLNLDNYFIGYNKLFEFRNLLNYFQWKSFDNGIIDSIEYLTRKISNSLIYDKIIPGLNTNQDDDDQMDVGSSSTGGGAFTSVGGTADAGATGGTIGTEPVLMSDEETVAYWNCRWNLIYILFLNNDYESVVKEFNQLINEDPINSIKSTDMEGYDNSFVVFRYLIRSIVISILISVPVSQYSQYWKLSFLKDSINSDVLIKNLIKNTTNCQFDSMNDQLSQISQEFEFDYQLSQITINFTTILNFKCLIVYFSCVDSVSLVHVATKFGLGVDHVKEMIMKLIFIFDLNLKLDLHNGIVKVIRDTKEYVLSSELNKVNRDLIVESKGVKINHLLSDLS